MHRIRNVLTKRVLKNLKDQVLKENPDCVFIEFSINDSVERFSASTEIAKDNLLNMIDRI